MDAVRLISGKTWKDSTLSMNLRQHGSLQRGQGRQWSRKNAANSAFALAQAQ
ncbi:hypothetical protein ACFFLM_05660 [Deinococcus oregonensis]|uniref:Uncharacterized protein n=1 Tax=Deinococcus oregonensis TaxID=1805970 RepID=A0ABV6AVC5_9DEIO